jgi:hypothetical protein
MEDHMKNQSTIGRYTIERVGQCDPGTSDHVKVKATIYLPTGEGGVLIPELRFHGRLCVCGESLYPHWGSLPDGSTERTHHNAFSAPTWREAEAGAEEWAEAELGKLRAMVRARERALRCA